MKLLLDQHLSRKLVAKLEPTFPGTTHVSFHGLTESDDDAIWEFARHGNFVIATKDEDFQLLSFSRGHPPKVLWLRGGNGPSAEVLATLVGAAATINEFGSDAQRSLLVVA